MIHSLDIVEEDSHVYNFPIHSFEFIYEPLVGFYILNDSGFFPFNDISEFTLSGNSASLLYEGDSFVVDLETYGQIKELFYKHCQK